MKRSRLGSAVALVLAGLLLAPAPAQAVEPPTIDRLTGRVLHTAAGDTITIPVPTERQNSLELLGKVRGGWLVAHHWDEDMLIVSPAGRIVRTIPYGQYEEYPGNAELELSGDGTRVAVLPIDRGDESPAVVLTLTGREVAHHTFTSYPIVLAKRKRTFYMALNRGLLAWQPGVSQRRITTGTVDAVHLGKGLIVRDVPEGTGHGDARKGLATLRHPERFRWTTHDWLFNPEFSPEGRRFAVDIRRHRVRVVSSRDGSTEASWRFPGKGVGTAERAWEDERHLLVELIRDDGDQHTLMRCTLGGGCERTVPWQAHPLLYWDYTRTR